MAFVSQSEFAKMCGKTPAHVSTYIRRGKIVKSGKLIDTTFEINKILMEHWQREGGILTTSEIIETLGNPKLIKLPELEFEDPKPVAKKMPGVAEGDISAGSYALDRKIKEAELESKEINTIRNSILYKRPIKD